MNFLKIIVFSDSHGNSRGMNAIMQKHRTAEYFFHLGDGNAEFENMRSQYPNTAFFSVQGNCDRIDSIFLRNQTTQDSIIEIDGFRFFITHGHRYNVKFGLSELIYHARQSKADVALFGHTHIKYYEYISGENDSKPLYLFNPGSISRPNDGSPSFGIIEIKNRNILFSNADYIY